MNARLIMTVEEMQNHEAWLGMRNKGIGGSDAGVIMGDNQWKSKYQLWLEKTGQARPEDISQKEPVYWGNILEDPVANRFVELTGKKVRKAGMMQNKNDPWMLANVDRLIIGEKAGLECKTTNAFSVKEWQEDNLPDGYYWQCQHYMMCTGLPVWYIAVLIGGQHFEYKAVPRCDADIEALYDAERTFWDVNVKSGIAPDIDGSASTTAALQDQYAECNGSAIELPNEAAVILQILDNFTEQEKAVKKAIQEQKNKLCAMLGDNEVGFVGERKVTWKMQNGRVTVDSKKLKTAFPDIYQQVVKQGKPLRVFRA